METEAYVQQMRLDGGHPALDYVNTLGGPEGGPPAPHDDYLRRYEDLAVLAWRVALIDEPTCERLLRRARRRPDEADAVFREALELRSLVDAVFRPVAHGQEPSARVLARLAEAERAVLEHAALERGGDGYRWAWSGNGALEAPLWPVTDAAVDLLRTGPLERLSVCHGCRWLYLDESKNASRRWCSMVECGTSAKKRRYVERRRARRAASARPRSA
jgi:predicted RNA-binding Zn ribbon-like protein